MGKMERNYFQDCGETGQGGMASRVTLSWSLRALLGTVVSGALPRSDGTKAVPKAHPQRILPASHTNTRTSWDWERDPSISCCSCSITSQGSAPPPAFIIIALLLFIIIFIIFYYLFRFIIIYFYLLFII